MESLIKTGVLDKACDKVRNGLLSAMDCLKSAERHVNTANNELKDFRREIQRVKTGIERKQREVDKIINELKQPNQIRTHP